LTSEFVYRCFERASDPRASIDVRLASVAGIDSRSVPPSGAATAEATLWEWASLFPDPKRRTAKWPKEPLEPLIAAFARLDSPNDPIVPRSYVADAAIVEPERSIDDHQLHAACVRFRDALLRLPDGSSAESWPEDRWHRFRQAASFVTPGDLRYSHSLQTVTSLRPSIRMRRGTDKRATQSETSDR
jgi:hypothetical protein